MFESPLKVIVCHKGSVNAELHSSSCLHVSCAAHVNLLMMICEPIVQDRISDFFGYEGTKDEVFSGIKLMNSNWFLS